MGNWGQVKCRYLKFNTFLNYFFYRKIQVVLLNYYVYTTCEFAIHEDKLSAVYFKI